MAEPTAVSERESEVLAAVAAHLTNAEISQRLHISVRTVESHVSSLLRKLGVADRRALARYGQELTRGEAEADATHDGQDGREPWPTGPLVLRGAPAALTSFIGRSAELATVDEVLAAARLVNFVGPGGVGKTRLAIEAAGRAATRFPGGAWFVDLVPVRGGGATAAVAAAIGLIDRANLSLEQVIEEALRTRRALLVVDNCEHVLEAVATLVERLLVACPGLQVMATSRELLGVTGERVVSVAPLDGTDAATLFVERTRSLDPAFDAETESERQSVAEVCDRLEGIPLAIELASARCAVLGLDGVRAGLDDQLRFLAGVRRGEDRHRSLRDVLDWSHELLDPTERAVLRRLGVFAGDFTANDAAEVVGEGLDPGTAVDAIGRLTAKSLLVRRSGGGTTVYRLLETVHEYAMERLAESGEGDATRRRHLDWALATIRAIERRVEAGDDWRQRFEAVAPDARVALGWAADQPAVVVAAHELARSHGHVAYARRFLTEAEACYEQASALAADDRAAVEDLRLAAAVAFARMRADRAYDHFVRAAERGADSEPALAAMSLADAVSLAWRCPAEFPAVPSYDEVLAMKARAEALDPGDDQEVAAHLAQARAWLASPEPLGGDVELARAAAAAAEELGDLALLSAALDAETSGLWNQWQVGAATRVAAKRRGVIDQMARHDPRTGGEILDMFHMVADTSLAAGRLSEALDHAAVLRKDEMGETAFHLAIREAVIALTLLGRFSEATAEADAMRREWERAGRPSAAWMAPAATAAELAYALLGDTEAAAEWRALASEIAGRGPSRSVNRTFMAFADARVAFHQGRLDDALTVITDWDKTVPSAYIAYCAALHAELAAVAGLPEAAELLVASRARVDENVWGNACLLRAEARLTGDPALMQAALRAFDELDARFEWAVTGLLVGGETAREAEATLADLGAAIPAPV